MKVIVAKMPGGKAVSVNLEEGATVMDAISAAGYSNGLEGGFELRKNDDPANADDLVAHSDIISLTAKITGNSQGIIKLAFKRNDGSYVRQDFLCSFPLKAKDFFAPDVDAKRLEIEAFILSHSERDDFNASDYVFYPIKKDQSSDVKAKGLNNCNYIAPETMIVIENKDSGDAPKVMSVDTAIKLYESMSEIHETSENIESNIDAAEKSEESKPKKKSQKPSKKTNKTACKCEDKCECKKEPRENTKDLDASLSALRRILIEVDKDETSVASISRYDMSIRDAIDLFRSLGYVLDYDRKISISIDLITHE